jgi:hypothetical protein
MEYNISPEEPVSQAVVTAVSIFEGRDPTTIDPLTETIDPDALDQIFTSRFNGRPRCGGRVSFVYSQSRITVDNNEYVEVSPVN